MVEPDFASYNVYGSQTEGFVADSSTLLGQGTLGNIDSNILNLLLQPLHGQILHLYIHKHILLIIMFILQP